MIGVMDLSFLKEPAPPASPYVLSEIVFLGAENYELYRLKADVHILSIEGGFKTRFRKPITIPAEVMMGKKRQPVTVADIEIRMPGMTLSMATMYPRTFPRVFTEGELVGVTN
jgi:hypothetical protein